MARHSLLPCLLLVALLASACHDHDDHEHEETQFICDGSEDSLAAGTSKVGDAGTLNLTIVEAIPPVHYVQNNELIVTVQGADGGYLSDAEFSSIVPFTAKHDHGTPIVAQWEPTANAGEYRIYDINYVHRGPWRIDIELSAGGATDTLQWIFCIEELPGSAGAR